MRHRYLLLLVLMYSLASPDLAQAQAQVQSQKLPPTVRSRTHSWYVEPTVSAIAPLRFISTSSLLQPAATTIQPTYGASLGYAHSPRFALETGLFYVPAYSGYRLNLYDNAAAVKMTESYGFAPLRLVVSVWEPSPQLAVRALVGAGYGWREKGALESYHFTQSQSFLTSPYPGGDTLTLRYTGAKRRNFFAAELGVRLEWKCGEDVVINFEAKNDMTLGAPISQYDYALANNTQGTTLAVAQLVSRQHVLSVGLGVRYIFYKNTVYRYRQVK